MKFAGQTSLALVVGLFVLAAGSSRAIAGGDDDLLDDLAAPAEDSKEASPAADVDALDAMPPSEPAASEKGAGDLDAPATSVKPTPRLTQGKTPPQRLDRVKAVPRKAVLKRQRLEVAAYPAIGVNDAYYRHYAMSASMVYHPVDAFGFGIGADYFLGHDRTGDVDILRRSMISVPAVFEPPRLLAHLDAYWVPIYGKWSLFDSQIVHFETYATVGVGGASALGSRWVQAVNAGVGQRFMLGKWMAVRIELRDHLFVDTVTVNGVERSDIQSYMLLAMGVSVFVPPSFEYHIR